MGEGAQADSWTASGPTLCGLPAKVWDLRFLILSWVPTRSLVLWFRTSQNLAKQQFLDPQDSEALSKTEYHISRSSITPKGCQTHTKSLL